ncbi:MAG: phosphate ABC transporter, permease protein PstA [Planctomycetales bacterium 4484_113]|nr:MAG: phosphate ABC transporter, permease protein PstA [Planctomycetales bacterium 4484_113]
MRLSTRKILDQTFTGIGGLATALLIISLLIVLGPIIVRGMGAIVFRETIERRVLFLEHFGRGNSETVEAERQRALRARQPIYDAIKEFEAGIIVKPLEEAAKQSYREFKEELREKGVYGSEGSEKLIETAKSVRDDFIAAVRLEDNEEARQLTQALIESPHRELLAGTAMDGVFRMAGDYLKTIETVDLSRRSAYTASLLELKDLIRQLLGPFPDDPRPILVRDQYGETRWDRARLVAHELLYKETYAEADSSGMRQGIEVPRVEQFRGTPVEPIFGMVESNLGEMMLPRLTFYWRFITDDSIDAHFFGGIWPSVLGTLYLALFAMLFAIPLGVAAAVYLAEYARGTPLIRIIRSCIDTLAAVPSIVFGLFGLAFFINVIGVSDSKSVLAGGLTLALLILPIIIRASEEAIHAVPSAYREASLALGASKGKCVLSVVLPAALPGILTGVIISLGRAAGETAPIIFTAAVSVGLPLRAWETLSKPSPVLPWTIYNLATEHQLVDQIRHVQYGMVLTLVVIVLLLNATAILLRARIAGRLRS